MNLQKLLSLTRQGIEAYSLIKENDYIGVGVSGGKDSLTLLVVMHALQKFYPKHFRLMAITCDVGFDGMDFSEVTALCEKLQIPYEIVHTQIAEIVFENHADKRPCSLCAKLRKGAMYQRLKELGVNKIAYAHNMDDFIETALMSLLYEGRFYSFPPLTELDKVQLTVIRPMIYVPEHMIASYAKQEKLPVVKNSCPVDGSTKRAYAKNLLMEMQKENKRAREQLLHAIEAADFEDWPEKSQ